jgi:metal-sulfur cluster biosynthetic enzyme
MVDERTTEAEIVARVTEAANRVDDPCALAQGVSIGMADMGLIRGLEVRKSPDGPAWDVTVTLRFTAPSCFYFSYFEDQLSQLLKSEPGIRLSFLWDDVFDWTPDSLSPDAREKLQRVRSGLVAIGRGPGAGRGPALPETAPRIASVAGRRLAGPPSPEEGAR